MAMVKNIEKKIWDKEGFQVRIMQSNRDVRGDKKGLKQWPYINQTKGSATVRDFQGKFHNIYPGFDIEVLDVDGKAVAGNMLLTNVRDTYIDDSE